MCQMVSNDCECGPMLDYMRSQVAPRPEEYSVISHLVGGGGEGHISDSLQVYVRTLKYCKLRASLGGPGPRGTCLLGEFVNGSDNSESSQMLSHGIHEPVRFITNIKSMGI